MECLPIRLVVDCDQNWKDLLIFDCSLIKTFEPTLANFECFWGQTLIIENGQMLDKQSSYLVTLLLSVFFLPRWYNININISSCNNILTIKMLASRVTKDFATSFPWRQSRLQWRLTPPIKTALNNISILGNYCEL